MKKVLLICPDFFSYPKIIKDELESIGFEVDWIDDRASAGFFRKSLIRFFPALGTRLIKRKFIEKISILGFNDYSYVLVVKGEGLSLDVIEYLKSRFFNSKFILYFWDSVLNHPNSIVISKEFDFIATFDSVDAKNYGWHYRPLFFKKKENFEKMGEFVYDLSFVGSVHSDRHKVVYLINKKYSNRYNTFFYIYCKNIFIRLYMSFFDKSLILNKNFLNKKSLSFVDYNSVINKSRAVLDIEHPLQNGLTMRTIETIISGKKLVTTNKAILRSNLFDSSRILVIDRENPELIEDFFKIDFLKIDKDIEDYYSLESWVCELLSLGKLHKSI